MKKIIIKLINLLGYNLVKIKDRKEDLKLPPDILEEKNFLSIYEKCKDYTMTSVERMYALYKGVEYIVENSIEGDLVECGVWRGGSAMLMALALQEFGDFSRQIYLYDTYEGMVKPSERDVNYKGNSAQELLKKQNKDDARSIWCYSPLEEVKENLKRVGYPMKNIKFIKGKVEETIPGVIPNKIALLRLDTDWHESTRHELKHLYPILTKNGVLIIDDYGHWQGVREAVDEYFKENKISGLLSRIDYTGRLMVKS